MPERAAWEQPQWNGLSACDTKNLKGNGQMDISAKNGIPARRQSRTPEPPAPPECSVTHAAYPAAACTAGRAINSGTS